MCPCNLASHINANSSDHQAFSFGNRYSFANLIARVAMLFFLCMAACGIVGLTTTGILPPESQGACIAEIAIGGCVSLGIGMGMYLLYRAKKDVGERIPNLVSQTWFWNVCASGSAISVNSSKADMIKLGMEYGSARFLSVVLIAIAIWGVLIGATGLAINPTSLSMQITFGVGVGALIAASLTTRSLDRTKRAINAALLFPQESFCSDFAADVWRRL